MLLFTLMSLMGCRDPDKLIGDSNVYGAPDEYPKGDTAMDEAYPEDASTIIEFESTDGDSVAEYDEPEVTTLSASIDGEAVKLVHEYLKAPCEHDFTQSYISSMEGFQIKLDYGFEPEDTISPCAYELVLRLYLQGLGLPPGIYEITANETSTEIDLTDYLSE